MPENPLLPHQTLRDLHALMIRCRELDRKQRSRQTMREGWLAGTTIHLGSGDLLSVTPDDIAAAQLAPEGKQGLRGLMSLDMKLGYRMPMCAAVAKGMQAAETDRLVLTFAQPEVFEPDWQEAMRWAHKAQLPLILACTDATGGKRLKPKRASPHIFDFGTMSRLSRRIELPLFPVDGEDAVAVYRVMQECCLRARSGGGPAVVWGVLPPLRSGLPRLKRSAMPVARMENYMSARNIPF